MVLDGVVALRGLTQVLWPVVEVILVQVVDDWTWLTSVMELEDDPMNLPLRTIKRGAEVAATIDTADGSSDLHALGLRIRPLPPAQDTTIEIEDLLEALEWWQRHNRLRRHGYHKDNTMLSVILDSSAHTFTPLLALQLLKACVGQQLIRLITALHRRKFSRLTLSPAVDRDLLLLQALPF